MVFKNKREDSHLSVAEAEAIVQSYKRIQMPQLQDNREQSAAVQKNWRPPPAGWFKVNVDATVKMDLQRTGLGIVLRDLEGKFVAAPMKSTNFINKVDHVEVEATKFELEIAKNT